MRAGPSARSAAIARGLRESAIHTLAEALGPQKVALVLGAEGEGMDRSLAGACDQQVSIPGSGAVESLNVASATAVLLAQWASRRG